MPTLSEGLKILIKGDPSGWNTALTQVTSSGLAASKQLTTAFGSAFRQMRNYGIAAFGAISGLIGGSLKSAAAFEKSFAEVTTLLDNMPESGLADLRDQMKDMGVTFGSSAVTQTKALYQAISAGATDAGDATALLADANKLAIGGVADLVPSIKLLASITNAYGMSFKDASQVTDTLFQTVKMGMTTVPELAESLGRVTSVAAQMGVPLEEVGAAIAFLTLKGLDTSESVTALRGALLETLKPSEQAKELAQELGFELDAQRVASEGLMPYLRDLADATQGNSEAVATFFGNQRALNGVLALTGAGAEKYNAIMAQMSEKAGVTDVAFGKMSNTLAFLWGQVQAQLGNLLITIGEAFIPILEKLIDKVTPIITSIADWVRENQELVCDLGLAVAGATGFVAIVGTLGAALMPLVTSVGLLAGGLLGVAGAVGIGPAIAIGGGLLAAFGALLLSTDDLTGKILGFVDDPGKEIQKTMKDAKQDADNWKASLDAVTSVFGGTLHTAIKEFTVTALKCIADIGFKIEWLIGKVKTVYGWFKDLANFLTGGNTVPGIAGLALFGPVGGLIANQFHEGGPVRRQTGGYVHGPGGIDRVPARLTAGEFVVNRDAMALFGPVIEAFNNAGRGLRAGAVTVNITTPSISRAFVRDTLVPELKRARDAGAY